ncbi:MAG TPA: nucleoside-diphosphate kinase [Actinomycetota bacterium]
MQRTLVLIKPDGVRRRLAGEVIRRLENKMLDIVAVRMLTVDEDLAKRHYEEHVDKPFFGELLAFITSGPVIAMAVEGDEAVSVVRQMMGTTDPKKAAPGTIRGDYAIIVTENLVHGSDSPDSAARELGLFFPDLR